MARRFVAARENKLDDEKKQALIVKDLMKSTMYAYVRMATATAIPALTLVPLLVVLYKLMIVNSGSRARAPSVTVLSDHAAHRESNTHALPYRSKAVCRHLCRCV